MYVHAFATIDTQTNISEIMIRSAINLHVSYQATDIVAHAQLA